MPLAPDMILFLSAEEEEEEGEEEESFLFFLPLFCPSKIDFWLAPRATIFSIRLLSTLNY